MSNKPIVVYTVQKSIYSKKENKTVENLNKEDYFSEPEPKSPETSSSIYYPKTDSYDRKIPIEDFKLSFSDDETKSVTVIPGDPLLFQCSSHGLVSGQTITFSSDTGSFPENISSGALYYVSAAVSNINLFAVSKTSTGSPISGSYSATGNIFFTTVDGPLESEAETTQLTAETPPPQPQDCFCDLNDWRYYIWCDIDNPTASGLKVVDSAIDPYDDFVGNYKLIGVVKDKEIQKNYIVQAILESSIDDWIDTFDPAEPEALQAVFCSDEPCRALCYSERLILKKLYDKQNDTGLLVKPDKFIENIQDDIRCISKVTKEKNTKQPIVAVLPRVVQLFSSEHPSLPVANNNTIYFCCEKADTIGKLPVNNYKYGVYDSTCWPDIATFTMPYLSQFTTTKAYVNNASDALQGLDIYHTALLSMACMLRNRYICLDETCFLINDDDYSLEDLVYLAFQLLKSYAVKFPDWDCESATDQDARSGECLKEIINYYTYTGNGSGRIACEENKEEKCIDIPSSSSDSSDSSESSSSESSSSSLSSGSFSSSSSTSSMSSMSSMSSLSSEGDDCIEKSPIPDIYKFIGITPENSYVVINSGSLYDVGTAVDECGTPYWTGGGSATLPSFKNAVYYNTYSAYQMRLVFQGGAEVDLGNSFTADPWGTLSLDWTYTSPLDPSASLTLSMSSCEDTTIISSSSNLSTFNGGEWAELKNWNEHNGASDPFGCGVYLPNQDIDVVINGNLTLPGIIIENAIVHNCIVSSGVTIGVHMEIYGDATFMSNSTISENIIITVFGGEVILQSGAVNNGSIVNVTGTVIFNNATNNGIVDALLTTFDGSDAANSNGATVSNDATFLNGACNSGSIGVIIGDPPNSCA